MRRHTVRPANCPSFPRYLSRETEVERRPYRVAGRRAVVDPARRGGSGPCLRRSGCHRRGRDSCRRSSGSARSAGDVACSEERRFTSQGGASYNEHDCSSAHGAPHD